VVRRAGEEILQRAADLLRQAVDEGREDGRFVVLGQVAGELLLLGLLEREAILARDQLRQLGAAEGLVAIVELLVVAQHLQAGGVGTDFEQGHQRIAAFVGQRRDHAAHRQARGVRLDVQDDRRQPGRLGQALAILHAVLARRGEQHLDITQRCRARADDAEVETHFVERERNVLIGFGLDLKLHLFLAQTGGQDDLLGDDRGLRHRHHHLLGAGAALADHAAHGFGDFVELLDLAIGDPALLEGFEREAFEHKIARRGLAEFHQLDAGRTHVQPDHRRRLSAQQLIQKTHVGALLMHPARRQVC
jgi:hypothetical protein